MPPKSVFFYFITDLAMPISSLELQPPSCRTLFITDLYQKQISLNKFYKFKNLIKLFYRSFFVWMQTKKLG
jgi:hypothetical protein